MSSSQQQKLLIAGAGIVGLTLALAVKEGLGEAVSVTVADPAWSEPRGAGRATAIAAGPRRMLETLGVWSRIAGKAQPILSMHVTDSKLRDVVRPAFLRFDGDAAPDEPFAHMVEDEILLAALLAACRDCGVAFNGGRVARLAPSAAQISVTLEDGADLAAHLAVAADGAQSRLRAQMKIATFGHDYPLAGLVATIAHQRPHGGRAVQHFLEQGPLALLPLTGERSSIVWTMRREEARRMAALPPDAFAAELEQAAGLYLGDLRLLDAPRVFPLALSLARSYVAPRFALAGDAAHVIHPLAGQGLNLGLRDAAALAEAVCDHARLGLDIGDGALLQRYQRARRFDALAMAGATDAMDRLFRVDFTPLRLLRDLGLGLVDRLPPLKALLIREAAALGPGAGRLFRGETL